MILLSIKVAQKFFTNWIKENVLLEKIFSNFIARYFFKLFLPIFLLFSVILFCSVIKINDNKKKSSKFLKEQTLKEQNQIQDSDSVLKGAADRELGRSKIRTAIILILSVLLFFSFLVLIVGSFLFIFENRQFLENKRIFEHIAIFFEKNKKIFERIEFFVESYEDIISNALLVLELSMVFLFLLILIVDLLQPPVINNKNDKSDEVSGNYMISGISRNDVSQSDLDLLV